MIFVLFILSIGSFFLVTYDWEVVLLLFLRGGGGVLFLNLPQGR